jgi:hypothetical protein
MPPSYWYVTERSSSRSSSSEIFNPLLRNADSRKRLLKVSKDSSWVSVKTSGSGRKVILVPFPSPFLSLRTFLSSPTGNPRS